MKKKLVVRILGLLTIMVLTSLEMFGQATGKISGKVTDKKTGEALIGLTVKIASAGKGAATDVEGRYVIGGLATGRYSLELSYLGYPTKRISDIDVKAGAITNLDVIMEEATGQQLEQVVVNVSAKQESISGLYAQQKNSVSISSGIVAEQIRRSPDRNTSEVLKRVSGTSIQDGKFVIIRGLADRYNTALINNSILPSSEPDRRAFSFDIVPSNLIDKVIISKTASPDLPGDFAGGVTQIITKDIPDRNFFGIAITSGYNSQSTFKNFRSNGRNATDFLGFDDGSRKLPSAFPASRQVYASAGIDKKVEYSKLLNNPYHTVENTALPVQSYQLNWGKVKTFKNEAVFGSILSLSYRNAQTIQDASRETFDGIQTNYSYNDDIYRYSSTWGALGNFTYKKNRTKISFKNLFNQTFEDSYVDRTGSSINQGDVLYSGSELNQKSLLNSQLEGDHRFGKKNLRLDWNLNYSLIKRDQPDLRNIMYGSSNGTYSLIDNFTRRFYSDLQENIYGGSVSFTMPFDVFGRKSSFKAGVLKQSRFRDFNARVFLYEPASFAEFDNSKSRLPMDVIFNTENIGRSGFALNDITNNSDSYEGTTDLNVGFLMLDNQLSDKFRMVWGVRAEDYYQDIDAVNNSGQPVKGDRTFFNLLPSFNLTYSINDKSNLRFSGSRTVSRPELRELAPFAFINQEENTQISGNPNLKLSNNTNADLRFEYYPSGGEAFTATVFYKNFQNPIEQVVGSSATYSNLTFTYANAKSAFSYGVELDVRKKLNFISDAPWLENLTASANLTIIESEVDLNQAGQAKRALQGQSPFLINGGLQYASKSGITLNALYNKIGSRIWRVGNVSSGIPDFYERGRDVVDLQIAKRIFKSRGELRLNVGDIFNQSQVFYQNYNSETKYNKSADTEFFKYKSGTTFTLGINYDLSFAH